MQIYLGTMESAEDLISNTNRYGVLQLRLHYLVAHTTPGLILGINTIN